MVAILQAEFFYKQGRHRRNGEAVDGFLPAQAGLMMVLVINYQRVELNPGQPGPAAKVLFLDLLKANLVRRQLGNVCGDRFSIDHVFWPNLVLRVFL